MKNIGIVLGEVYKRGTKGEIRPMGLEFRGREVMDRWVREEN